MNLVTVAQTLIRKFRILLLCATLGACIGLGSYFISNAYVATSTLLIGPGTESELRQYTSQPDRFVRSEMRLAASDLVAARARELLSTSAAGRSFHHVEVTGGGLDNVIQIHVRASTATAASASSTAVADSYGELTSAETEVLSGAETTKERRLDMSATWGALAGLTIAAAAVLGTAWWHEADK